MRLLCLSQIANAILPHRLHHLHSPSHRKNVKIAKNMIHVKFIKNINGIWWVQVAQIQGVK